MRPSQLESDRQCDTHVVLSLTALMALRLRSSVPIPSCVSNYLGKLTLPEISTGQLQHFLGQDVNPPKAI